MNNLNPYNEDVFKQEFKNSIIYKKLTQDFDENNLIWDKFFHLLIDKKHISLRETPRAMYPNHFSVSVFYYLLPLLENNCTTIYDLGCGKNMFKSYLPNLIGVGAEDLFFVKQYNKVKDIGWPDIVDRQEFTTLPLWIQDECVHQHKIDLDNPYFAVVFYGDIHGFVDDEYVACHQNYFESVFSICALHFHPIDQFYKIVKDFSSMIRPNGRGFISLNIQKMIEFSSPELLISLFGNTTPSQYQFDQYIRHELDKLDLNWLIVDVDLTLMDEGMNGNIRLVFKK